MKKLNSYIATAHRWSGLIVGLYVVLISLSGAAMVFQGELFEWEFGSDIMEPTTLTAPATTVDTWINNAQEEYGPIEDIEGIYGPGTIPIGLPVPTIIYDTTLANGGHGHGVVVIDPDTGQPKAHFIAEETMAVWPLRLHLSLFLGNAFVPVLMSISVLLIFFVLSGLYLWLQQPRIQKSDLAFAGINSPPKLRKSHTSLGIWLSAAIIIFALTGFGLIRFDLAMKFADVVGRTEGIPLDQQSQSCEVPSHNNAWAKAETLYPNHEVTMFLLPTDARPYYQIFMRPDNKDTPTRGDTEIHIKKDCLKTIYARSGEDNMLGDTILTQLFDLHNGKILGWFGETLVFILGVIMSLSAFLGMSAWIWRELLLKKGT